MANRVAGAKRHELCGPKGQVLYLPRGNSRPWDDNPSTTMVLHLQRDKSPISQEEILIHETTTRRLPQYSTFGGTSSLSSRRPIHPWGDYSSTTTVLDLRMGQVPYLPRGNSRPWDDNRRLLRYSTFGWDKFPISQDNLVIHEVTIHWMLWHSTQAETRSLPPKRIYSSMRWQHVDYHDARLQEDTRLLIPKRNHLRRRRLVVDTIFWHVSRKDVDLKETKRCTGLESVDGVCPMG
jgi:hypothetical protein